MSGCQQLIYTNTKTTKNDDPLEMEKEWVENQALQGKKGRTQRTGAAAPASKERESLRRKGEAAVRGRLLGPPGAQEVCSI